MATSDTSNSTFFSDEPIRTLEEDCLNREGFVKQLLEAILKWDKNDCLIMALCGPWGTGKTSMLNMIQDELSKEDCDIHMTFFDPWYFNEQEKLIRSFFHTLNTAMDSFLDPNEQYKMGNLFRQYAKKISITVDPEISLFSMIKLRLSTWALWNEGADDPAKIREDIRQELRRIDRKILVVIDNIDRLDKDEVLLMFKLIRLCSDFPNLIFILAFDRDQVSRLISKSEIDTDYLYKIIQVEISLPLLSRADIDNFIFKEIGTILICNSVEIDKNMETRFFRYIYPKYISGKVIKDLRNAKRYLNGLRFNLPLVTQEVNYVDFFITELLRIFYSPIYLQLPKYKEELTNTKVYLERDDQGKDRNKKLDELINLIKTEAGKDAVYVNGLLGQIFPIFREYLQSPSKPSERQNGIEDWKNQYIYVEEFFNRYFMFMVPGYEIPTANVNNIIAMANDEQKSLDEIIGKIFKNKDSEETLRKLLVKMGYFYENMTNTGKSRMIAVLLQVIMNLEGTDSFELTGEVKQWIELVLTLLIPLGDSGKKIFLEIIENRDIPLLLAASLINRGIGKEYIQEKNDPNQGIIREIILSRIQQQIIPLKERIFDNYRSSYYYIINFWKKEFINDNENASEFILNLLEHNPQKLPVLLGIYVTFDEFGNIDYFDFSPLEYAYDKNRIFKILELINEDEIENPYHKSIITAYKKHNGGVTNPPE